MHECRRRTAVVKGLEETKSAEEYVAVVASIRRQFVSRNTVTVTEREFDQCASLFATRHVSN